MPSSDLERKPDYSRLTRAEVASILSLHRAGKNQVEIAQALNCHVSNVSRWLAKLTDTTDLAKQLTRNAAQKLAKRVIDEADVDQSLEVLDRLDVLPKRREDKSSGGINVLVLAAGQTQLQPPSIPVNVISNYQTQTQGEG